MNDEKIFKIILVSFLSLGVFLVSLNIGMSYLYGYLAIFFSGLCLFLMLVIKLLQQRQIDYLIVIALFTSFLVLWIPNSELFKSKQMFTANTVGRSYGSWYLTLRKNGKYELTATSLLTQDSYRGKYKIEGNAITLLDKNTAADYIPDTLTIFCHKIPIYFEDGQPNLTDTYFKIHSNKLIPLEDHCPEEFDYKWSSSTP